MTRSMCDSGLARACQRGTWGLKTTGTARRGHDIPQSYHITPGSESKRCAIDLSTDAAVAGQPIAHNVSLARVT